MSVKYKVGIVMGSDSDYEIMAEAAKALREFDIDFEMTVASAHRSPERAGIWARTARDRGLSCLIAGAGAAAHLAGALAAQTTLPVIGIPISGSGSLGGLDALLATVQMLAASDVQLAAQLSDFRKKMALGVEEKAARLEARLKQDGLV
jgi:5-(carboxyamino)imidazole ribonucleotide mutase